MLYTGTTGFRHTDGINDGRPVVQSKLEALGYTVDWEDCNDRGPGADELQQRGQEPADLHGREPRALRRDRAAEHVVVVAGGNRRARCSTDPQKNAIIKFVQNGGGIAAIHNATDAGAGQSIWDWWDGGAELRRRHDHARSRRRRTPPATRRRCRSADPNHLSTKDLPDTWTFGDEHYNFLRNVRGDHHVLATFDERTYNPGVNARARTTRSPGASSTTAPTSTTARRRRRTYNDGRTWITGMGHFGVRYTENGGDNNLVKMIVGGIRWVAGEGKKTDCSGTVWSSFHRTVLVADANQPIGIDVAKDGKVYWSEMGRLGTAANNYNSQGAIMMHDQKGPPGNKTTVGTILTRADHGNSEDGVLGMSLQPGFDLADPNKRQRLRVLLAAPGPGDNWPTGPRPPQQVVGYNQISRFTLTADGKAVVAGLRARDPARAQGQDRSARRRASRAVRRTPARATWVAPAWTSTPPATCTSASVTTCRRTPPATAATRRWTTAPPSAGTPARPRPTRPTCAARCCASRRSRATSRRTRRPASAPTYDIPQGNLFPAGTAEDASRDLRDGLPSAVHACTPTRRTRASIGVGEYCHDASADRPDRSPAGTCEWNLINKAGNFGWPFCVGDQSPANTSDALELREPTRDGPEVRLLDGRRSRRTSTTRRTGQTPNPPTFQGLAHDPEADTRRRSGRSTPSANNTGMQNPADFGDLTGRRHAADRRPDLPLQRGDGRLGGFPAYYDGSWLINNRGANDGWWKEVRLRQDNNKMLRVQRLAAVQPRRQRDHAAEQPGDRHAVR